MRDDLVLGAAPHESIRISTATTSSTPPTPPSSTASVLPDHSSQTFSDEPETETVFFTVGEDFNGFFIVARAVESVSRSGGWTEIDMGSVAIALQAADAD